MHSVIHIALNDLRIFFASRRNVIGLLVLPIGFTLLVGFFFPRGRDAGLIVDVIDHDDSQVSTGLVNALRAANTSLVLCPMDNDAENICNVEDDTALDRAWATWRRYSSAWCRRTSLLPRSKARCSASSFSRSCSATS